MNEMKGEEGKSMRNKMKYKEKRSLKELKNSAKGITLIALVITIALNCLRSGRKLEYTA